MTQLARRSMHLGLLMVGMYFSINGFYDYLEEKTTFSLEEHPLTTSDLPTVTICFAKYGFKTLQYGHDIVIRKALTKIKYLLVKKFHRGKLRHVSSPPLGSHFPEGCVTPFMANIS